MTVPELIVAGSIQGGWWHAGGACNAKASGCGSNIIVDGLRGIVPGATTNRWTRSDFVHHYFYGRGRAVNLAEIGLADAFVNATSVRQRAADFEFDVLMFGERNRIYNARLLTDVTNESDSLWAIGRSVIFATATCVEGSCTFSYSLRDRFSDSLTIGGRSYFGGREIPLGTPYQINHDWRGAPGLQFGDD